MKKVFAAAALVMITSIASATEVTNNDLYQAERCARAAEYVVGAIKIQDDYEIAAKYLEVQYQVGADKGEAGRRYPSKDNINSAWMAVRSLLANGMDIKEGETDRRWLTSYGAAFCVSLEMRRLTKIKLVPERTSF